MFELFLVVVVEFLVPDVVVFRVTFEALVPVAAWFLVDP